MLCDNEAVFDIINRGQFSSPDIMLFLRRLTWLSVVHNFIFTARHVPGYTNVIADSLSRFKFQIFHRLFPDASPFPTPVPPHTELDLS